MLGRPLCDMRVPGSYQIRRIKRRRFLGADLGTGRGGERVCEPHGGR